MHCGTCAEKAVWLQPALCAKHFTNYFEEKVKCTIDEYELIPSKAVVTVAVSGGKDSLTILHILHKLGHSCNALLVDEGIADYREHTIIDAKRFCEARDIPLRIVTFEDLTGKKLDDMLRENPDARACTVCGTFRRHLLNAHADGDVLATGHNADDEAQAVLMNILRAQTTMMTRPGPATNAGGGFTRRIKPLYFCTEKEIMTYALLQGFAGDFTECPNARASYRARVRDVLNAYEAKHPGAKQRILAHHLRLQLPKDSTPLRQCSRCGEPSTGDVCASCKMLVTIKH